MRLLLAAAVAACALLTTGAQAAPAASRHLSVIEEVSPGAGGGAELRFRVTASAGGEDGLLMTVGMPRTPARRVGDHFVSYADVGRRTVPGAYGTTLPECPAVPSCGTAVDDGTFTVDTSAPQTAGNRLDWWLVATVGDEPEIVVRTPGWRVRRLHASGFRSTRGDATGVTAGSVQVEQLRGAQAAGGPRGSVALALSSCTDAGTGAVRLEGGQAPRDIPCPTVPLVSAGGFGSDVAAGPAQWRLVGETVGAGQARLRLGVVDVPAEPGTTTSSATVAGGPRSPRLPRAGAPAVTGLRAGAPALAQLPATGPAVPPAAAAALVLAWALSRRAAG